jgi:hypothetical protein
MLFKLKIPFFKQNMALYDDRNVRNFYYFFDGLLEMGFIFVGG